VAISARAILTDQFFRRRVKRAEIILPGNCLQIRQSLASPLAWITPTGLLQVAEDLLAQAAVMLPCTQLKQLMQRVGHVSDLQRGH
jgi:hypothetical protein